MVCMLMHTCCVYIFKTFMNSHCGKPGTLTPNTQTLNDKLSCYQHNVQLYF